MKTIRSIYRAIVILSAAGLMAGCSSDDYVETKGTIRFRVSDEWIQGTRALANSATDLEAKSFCVLGKYSAGAPYDASALQTVFDNQEVSYTDASGWDYNPKKNWEKSSTYRFCAYWPKTAGMTLTGNLDGTIRLAGFVGENVAANHTDLMLSSVAQQIIDNDPRQMSETSDNMVHDGVSLTFHHLLCNVKVAVKKEGETEIHVTSVQLVNIPNRGDFSTNYNDWNSGIPNGTWTVDTYEETEYNSGTTNVELSTSYQTIPGDFLVIPQTVNTDRMKIRVAFTSNGQRKSYEVPLPGTPQWQMFKKITYQLTIDENEYIKFGTPIVESWGTAQASGTIIIK